MKKLLKLLLCSATLLLIPLLSGCFGGANGLSFEAYGDNGYAVYGGLFFHGDVVEIPSEYEGKPVVAIKENAFMGQQSLTSVVIPDTVTYIGDDAFHSCVNLVSVNIPESVTYIGKSAFTYCRSLTEVTLPEGLTCINDWCFQSCGSLTEIAIPDSVTEIGEDAFSNSNIRIITFGSGLTEIGRRAFSQCNNLRTLVIPDSVTEIGENAFSCCEKLAFLTLGNGITKIRDHTFYWCKGLISVTLSENITAIGNNAFGCCEKLYEICNPTSLKLFAGKSDYGEIALNAKHIRTTTQESNVMEYDDFVFFYDGDECILTGYIGNECVLNFPDTAPLGGKYNVGNQAFENWQNITEIVMSNAVQKIGKNAFAFCMNLTGITLSKDLSFIDDCAFSGCDKLNAVHIRDLKGWCKVEFFTQSSCPLKGGHNLYVDDTLVTDLVIPDGVEKVGDSAFIGCTSITSVTIPDGVTEIGRCAFFGCTQLKTVNVGKDLERISAFAFSDCTGIDKVYISNIAAWCEISFDFDGKTNPLAFGATLYVNGTPVTDLVIPDGVTTVRDRAFCGCNSLESVTIPASVDCIHYSAFGDCKSLKSVTLNNMDRIAGRVFEGCDALTDITFNGTKAEWEYLYYSENYGNKVTFTVHCQDGDIVP